MSNEKVDFDEYRDRYNELLHEGTSFFSEDDSYFSRQKARAVRAAIASPVTRILEFGCGIGRNLPHLQAAFPQAEVVGTDIASESLDMAREANPTIRLALEEPGLDLGHFDLIFVAGVYHHVPPAERAAVSALLASRLAPGGSLCVFEHNPYNPVTRKIVNQCAYDADAVLLKPAELRGHLRGAGLDAGSATYCLFIPPKLPFLLPIESVLGWLPLGGQYWIRARAA